MKEKIAEKIKRLETDEYKSFSKEELKGKGALKVCFALLPGKETRIGRKNLRRK
ncbi:MAG: hypothetical protein MRJ65_16900 [Candidatus Brocadiaceae bacterium]|nr:hypothetical protein [Candidatus Brocadiaceae bacterium]